MVELGLTAALGAGLPDTTRNQIAAAVLLYRALTWFLPIPLGVGALLFWQADATWRQTVAERDQTTPDIAHPPLPPGGSEPAHAASAAAPAGRGP